LSTQKPAEDYRFRSQTGNMRVLNGSIEIRLELAGRGISAGRFANMRGDRVWCGYGGTPQQKHLFRATLG